MTFSIEDFTKAPLRLRSRISYTGHSAADVFDIMGDPNRITDWYLLAKEVHIHDADEGEEASFTVEFTFFGKVLEEILHWDPPRRYVYIARGDEFPIKDYVACIEIEESGPDQGVLSWDIYCSQIDGEHFQRILPVMLPAVNEASMQALSKLIGGSSCDVTSFF